MMSAEIRVPVLGESITSATIARWLKQPGDALRADEPVVELETDKVSIEVPAPAAGVLGAHEAETGTEVSVGSLLAQIANANGAAPPQPASSPQPEKVETPAAPPASTPAPLPAAKRMIEENNLDPKTLGTGTGRGSRLTKGDVLDFLETRTPEPTPPQPTTPKPQDTRETRIRMTRLRQTIARRLKDAQSTAAILTTFNEIDMSAAKQLRADYREAFEKAHGGARLGFMSIFARATILALREFPMINAEIDGEDIVTRDFVNLGIAISSPRGLVVPVLHDADQMDFATIERTIATYGKRAKDGTLALQDLTGGTFSITNGGVFGSLLSTPILNTPQSGILGMHAIQDRPIAVNGQVVIRPMMYVALSYDHRIVDGREAVSFLVRIKQLVEDPRRMLLGL